MYPAIIPYMNDKATSLAHKNEKNKNNHVSIFEYFLEVGSLRIVKVDCVNRQKYLCQMPI